MFVMTKVAKVFTKKTKNNRYKLILYPSLKHSTQGIEVTLVSILIDKDSTRTHTAENF